MAWDLRNSSDLIRGKKRQHNKSHIYVVWFWSDAKTDVFDTFDHLCIGQGKGQGQRGKDKETVAIGYRKTNKVNRN